MMGIIATVIWAYQLVLFIRFIMQWIDKVDTNKDGTISREEHQAARATMRAKWQEMRGERDKG